MQSKIERQVMAGVGAVYAARQLAGTTALKLYVCVLSLWGLGKLVFVERVQQNLAQVGWENSLQFFADALLNTDVAVQVVFAAFVVAGLWLARDLVRMSGGSSARFA